MASSIQLGDVLETTCDHCGSRFRITEAQLHQALGQARCSECGATFNALLALRNYEGELPPGYDDETIVDDEPLEHVVEARRELSLHEAMYGSERRAWFSLGPVSWFIGIILLTTLGLAQAIYYQRYQLIEDPRFQQQVLQLCEFLPCANSQFSSTKQLRLLERNVFTHPVAGDALMVTGAFINQAPFPQRMPDLLISLFDVQGKLIANRLFKPAEYLLEDRNRSVVQPDRPIQFRIEIVDPGTDALTYEFEFY